MTEKENSSDDLRAGLAEFGFALIGSGKAGRLAAYRDGVEVRAGSADALLRRVARKADAIARGASVSGSNESVGFDPGSSAGPRVSRR